jgi:hypothetical protein
MSDPQDLLYTNKFISTDILTDNQVFHKTKLPYSPLLQNF